LSFKEHAEIEQSKYVLSTQVTSRR